MNGEDALLRVAVYLNAPDIIIIDHTIIMIPKDIHGWFRTVPENANQLKRAPTPNMFVRLPKDFRFGLCKKKEKLEHERMINDFLILKYYLESKTLTFQFQFP